MHACDGVLLCDRCLWSRDGHLCVLTLGIGNGCLRLALGTDKIVRLLPVPQCLVGHKYAILLSPCVLVL